MGDERRPTDLDSAMNNTAFHANVPHEPEGSNGSLSTPAANTDSAATDCDVNDASESYERERDQFFRILPTAYRFRPTDQELLHNYLQPKVENRTLPFNKITDLNLYNYNPEFLAENYQQDGANELYFFTPRYRKYQNGKRPRRTTEGGYWKSSGADKPVQSNGMIIGFKKVLMFYMGKYQDGEKSNWIMYEYRLAHAPPPSRTDEDDMKLDEWVLCKIYKKRGKPAVRRQDEDPMLGTSAPETSSSGSTTSTPGTSAPFPDLANENYPREMSGDPNGAYGRSAVHQRSIFHADTGYQFHAGGTLVQNLPNFHAATANQFHGGRTTVQQLPTFRTAAADQSHGGGTPVQQRPNPHAATADQFHGEGTSVQQQPTSHATTNDQFDGADASGYNNASG